MPEKRFKTLQAHARIKSFDDTTGTIEAIVSVFNNVDMGNDRVRPGAFAKSIANRLPKFAWCHDWKQPIGKTLEAKELMPGDPLLDSENSMLGGLWVKGQLNLETQRGREAYSDLKFGSIDEFSIGYDPVQEATSKDGANELIEIDLFEWSPVLVGMNRATSLVGIKSVDTTQPAQDFLKVKSLYLGDYTESYMSIAAIGTLLDQLMYNVVYDQLLYESDETPTEKVIEVLSGACDEFKDLLIKTVTALRANPTPDAAEAAAKTLRVIFSDPQQSKDLNDASAPVRMKLLAQSQTLLAGAKGLAARIKTVLELRAKEGRTHSAETVNTVMDNCKAIREAADNLEALVTGEQAEAEVALDVIGDTEKSVAEPATKTAPVAELDAELEQKALDVQAEALALLSEADLIGV